MCHYYLISNQIKKRNKQAALLILRCTTVIRSVRHHIRYFAARQIYVIHQLEQKRFHRLFLSCSHWRLFYFNF